MIIKTSKLCKSIPPMSRSDQVPEQTTADASDSKGELVILQDIDLEVAAGESLAITGTSGSGKSTLLGLLAGLDQPTSGYVELFGQRLNDLNEDQRAALRQGQVGFVFQSFHLLEHLTALENVMLPLELLSDVKNVHEQAMQALEQVGLKTRMQHFARQLSGGEQQRVALARAFVTQPKILFADEPTGNLDSRTGKEISDLLFKLQEESGTTLILVTHDQSLANRCQQQCVLNAGAQA